MKISAQQVFPLILIILDLGAAIVYWFAHNPRKVIYWIAAGVLNAAVTF